MFDHSRVVAYLKADQALSFIQMLDQDASDGLELAVSDDGSLVLMWRK